MKNGDYSMVVAPDDYIGKKYRNKYCYEHHLVYWKEYGLIPKKGEVIHHINGQKTDNRIENLELLSIDKHNKLHSIQKEMITLTCAFCGNEFEKEMHKIKPKLKAGQKDFYCNRSCMARHFGRGRKKF